MTASDTVSIVVPALNEEANLEAAVAVMLEAADRWFADYEILLFDDGSTDRTGAIADALAARHPRVKAFHHDRPHNMGGVIGKGYRLATMHYAIWVDGKGATPAESLDAIFSRKGQADLVIPYSTNTRLRSRGRRIVSAVFRGIVNTLFGLRLHYHLHSVLCRREQVNQFTVRTASYAWQAEALVKMIRSGCTWIEVGVEDRYDDEGRASKAFRWKNIRGVAGFLLRTFWDVYIRRDLRRVRA